MNTKILISSGRPATPSRHVINVDLDDTDEVESDDEDEIGSAESMSDDEVEIVEAEVEIVEAEVMITLILIVGPMPTESSSTREAAASRPLHQADYP